MLALSSPPCPSTPLLFRSVLEFHQKALKWQKDWEPARGAGAAVRGRGAADTPALTSTLSFGGS